MFGFLIGVFFDRREESKCEPLVKHAPAIEPEASEAENYPLSSSADDKILAEALDAVETTILGSGSCLHVTDTAAMPPAGDSAAAAVMMGSHSPGDRLMIEALESVEASRGLTHSADTCSQRCSIALSAPQSPQSRVPEGPIMDSGQIFAVSGAGEEENWIDDEDMALCAADLQIDPIGDAQSVGGSTAACLPPSQKEEIRILYATDGYPVVCSLHLLLGQALLQELYVIAYSHVTEPSAHGGGLLRATFYLLAATGCERQRQRVRPVFVCSFTGEAADKTREALREGKPLMVQDVIASLDEAQSLALHEDLIIALGTICSAGKTAAAPGGDERNLSYNYVASTLPGLRRTLASLMLQYETRVVAAFRRKYNASFSCPFWFVSKFGPSETSLVAVLRYYLLGATQDDGIAGSFDLQGVKDLAVTFPKPGANASGLTAARLNTFAEFSRFWCCSELAGPKAEKLFREYLKTRVSSDTLYVQSLDSLIEKYRHALRLPAKDFVRFVYLAYHEGYNRAAVEAHMEEALRNGGRAETAATRAQSEFFKGLREMCSMPEYFARNVDVAVKRLPVRVAEEHARLRSYGEIPRSGFWGFCWPSYDVSLRINKICAGPLCCLGTQLADAMVRAPPDDGDKGTCAETAATIIHHDSDASGEEEATVKVCGAHMPRANKRAGDGTRISPACNEADTRAPLARLTALAYSDQRPRGIMPVTLLLYSLDDTSSGADTAVKSEAKAQDRPVPVYRVAMPGGGQAFAVVARDQWDKTVTVDVFSGFMAPKSPPESNGPLGSDKDAAAVDDAWTRALLARAWGTSYARRCAANVGASQLYLNRNEVLSDSLAVCNLPLDLDITLKPSSVGRPSMLTLHMAMRSVREAIVLLWSLLFADAEIDPDTYPVYFYKTQCDAAAGDEEASPQRRGVGGGDDDVAWGEEDVEIEEMWGGYYSQTAMNDDMIWDDAPDPQMDIDSDHPAHEPMDDGAGAAIEEMKTAAAARFCRCERKIGFRICVPIPKPYALAGLSVAKATSALVQQAIVLQEKFVEALDQFIADYEFVDSGVYSAGRSLRLPFFAKVNARGVMVGRLLPFLVFPPKCRDRSEFVAQHADPNNFHVGAARRDNPAPTLIITSVTVRRDVLAQDNRAHGKPRAGTARLADALAAVGIVPGNQQGTPGDACAVDASWLLDSVAMPALREYIDEHFPRHAAEYRDARTDCIRVYEGRICAALRRGGAGYMSGRRSNFTCLKYQHRGASMQTVIASVVVAVNSQGLPYAALQTRCFATKCGSNELQTQFTVTLSATKDV
ncbi:DNA helicase primase component [Psittacid alphaherpesvirus 1]|uniref:DNA primase n=1 Tax=Psittacid herpesvirus 1 (isolate Amazon parrot/-/97-0001/1997) TaxID=670426 RepID=PRIM_PSHV1|nr:helicase-primase primase subunit [Psittacid alphaherpesvirus 1]Q6UDM2.1 RecName: Full=DNA primase [Psittacid herpesvirus 1 Amazon parrot/1997]AAQ73688.1 DNA helicase primase component [Psittacid alphaherpesvirus 1]